MLSVLFCSNLNRFLIPYSVQMPQVPEVASCCCSSGCDSSIALIWSPQHPQAYTPVFGVRCAKQLRHHQSSSTPAQRSRPPRPAVTGALSHQATGMKVAERSKVNSVRPAPPLRSSHSPRIAPGDERCLVYRLRTFLTDTTETVRTIPFAPSATQPLPR